MKNPIRLLSENINKPLKDWIHTREFFRPTEYPLRIGLPTIVEVRSRRSPLSVVFEDDGETAYIYAVDYADPMQPIQAAFHIYSVNDFGQTPSQSRLRIHWSEDGTRVDLSIDRQPFALIDFVSRSGYCRSKFQMSSHW